MLVKQLCYIQSKCIDYIINDMVVFLYNLYIFRIHLYTTLLFVYAYNRFSLFDSYFLHFESELLDLKLFRYIEIT